MRSDVYRAKAAEMTRLGERAEPGDDRESYVRLAAIWSEMAELASKLEAEAANDAV